jgi:hypothetical protein
MVARVANQVDDQVGERGRTGRRATSRVRIYPARALPTAPHRLAPTDIDGLFPGLMPIGAQSKCPTISLFLT